MRGCSGCGSRPAVEEFITSSKVLRKMAISSFEPTVMRTLLKMMGRDPDDFEHVRDRAGHDLRYAIDPSALYDELGWAPKHTDFSEGLQATIDWYRDNEWWWRPLKDVTEARYEGRGK